ncbi:lipooligosaccharide transport system permease protein [Allocatelliglobosispora scoriae]|uniref:Transport permease protein n=1 Tax=Allocatelliglobosispora scoriae TaxID=643052 RepID=A0A841BQM8_9ACTN|nr:ABC transporter permease [Allocatelliglobosispora scoriae]MBB5869688.1 lipooligosaccharide transport system permease protein [Allocatelliglobosispora scoriae]
MVTTLITGTAVRAGLVSPSRIGAVINRNIGALRSGPSYWLVLVSGFFEPLLYLLSIGIGVGALVGDLTLRDGSVVSYAMFVAPAMLATSAMSGAMAETTFNFFFKMKYVRTFDAILATPVRPFEIALGELTWAIMRGSLYTAVFLMIMVAMGLASIGGALLAFPATILVGFAFGALGMAISSMLRGWQDFDILMTSQFALFLFSGTFAPISNYPTVFEVLIRITPLWHAVEMVRAITLGTIGWATLGHAAYLAGMMAIGLFFTGRRLEKVLLK